MWFDYNWDDVFSAWTAEQCQRVLMKDCAALDALVVMPSIVHKKGIIKINENNEL